MSRLIICIYQMGIIPITVINRYGAYCFVLIECEESFEKLFLRLTAPIKLTVIAPCVLAMRARLSASAILCIHSGDTRAGAGGRLYLFSENRKPSSMPDSVCRDPQKFRDTFTRHPLWGRLRQPLHQLWPLHYRCPTLYLLCCLLTSPMMKNPQRGERRRQWAKAGMVPGLYDMAGGHGFREKPGERLRYRALHKVNDWAKARNGIEHHMCVVAAPLRRSPLLANVIKFLLIINKMTAAAPGRCW